MEQKVHLFKYLSEQRVAEGCNAVGDAGADECAWQRGITSTKAMRGWWWAGGGQGWGGGVMPLGAMLLDENNASNLAATDTTGSVA